MKTADREHRLLGRIRPWDALIILLRLPVSPQPLTSHLFLFPHLPYSYGFGPGVFYFLPWLDMRVPWLSLSPLVPRSI